MPKAPLPMFFTTSYLAKRDCVAPGAKRWGDVVSNGAKRSTPYAVHDAIPCVTHSLCCAVSCCAVLLLCATHTRRTFASPPGALGASFHTRRKPRVGCEICFLRLFGLFCGLTWLSFGLRCCLGFWGWGSGWGVDLSSLSCRTIHGARRHRLPREVCEAARRCL